MTRGAGVIPAFVAGGSTIVALLLPALGPRRVGHALTALRPTAAPPVRELGRRTGTAGGRSGQVRTAAALAAAVAVWMTVGGWRGLAVAGVVGAGLAFWLGRLDSRAEVDEQKEVSAAIPVAADLLAACLLAGAPLDRAVASVAQALGGPLGRALTDVVAALRLGADPARCWDDMAADPASGPLGRALRRGNSSGSPIVEVVVRLADEQREVSRWRAQEAARRVGVLVVAPLGLCFLPAFFAIGVAPLAIGMAATVWPAFG